MRIYTNKTNIINGDPIILTIDSPDSVSAIIAWGNGTSINYSTSQSISYIYPSDGDYDITVTTITDHTLGYSINVGDFILDNSSNIRLIEEDLQLPYDKLTIPSNDILNSDIINYISNNLYLNWSYLKNSAIIVDPVLPTQYRGWYGTLSGNTGWYNNITDSASNTLSTNYVDMALSANYIILAKENEISFHLNNVNLTQIFAITNYIENIPFSNIKNITLDNKGRLFVSDSNFIYKFNINIDSEEFYCLHKLPISNVRGKYHKNISDISFDENNNLYVVDSEFSEFTVYDVNLNQKVRIKDGLSGLEPKSLFTNNNYIFVITDERKLIKYDNQYIPIETISLSSDITDSEEILKIKIENNKQIVYILTDTNIYKYFYENDIITLITSITNFNLDSLNGDKFVSMAFDNDYNFYALENNQIDAFDIRSTTTKQIELATIPWTLEDLLLSKDSYIQNEVYNIILKRHFDLNTLLLKGIGTQIVKLFYPGNITDKFYIYLNYNYTDSINTNDLFIYHNEKLSYGILQRSFEKIFQIQEIILSIIKMETDSAILTKIRNLIFKDLYPVGETLQTTREGNPSTWLGFGVWERYGEGLVLVGYKSGDSNFGTVGLTGGEITHVLTTAELPSHTHTGTTLSGGLHRHNIAGAVCNGSILANATDTISLVSNLASGNLDYVLFASNSTINLGATSLSGAHTHTFTTDSAGSGSSHNNIQPYIVEYFWRRTA